MSISVNLNVIMAKRNVKLKDLAKFVGITEQNLSILKNGKAKAIRFSTLNSICEYLDCDVSDIISYSKTNKKI